MRAADSEKSVTNGSASSGRKIRAPMPARNAISTSAAPGPTETSCAAVTQPSRDPATRLSDVPLGCRSTFGGVPPRWSCTCAHSDPPNSSRVSPSNRWTHRRCSRPWRSPLDVVNDTKHTNDGRWEDRGLASLVVETDVAAGHRYAEFQAAICQPAHCLGKLPHDARVFGRAEVKTVGHGQRLRACRRDIPIRLCKRQLCALVGVEFPTVRCHRCSLRRRGRRPRSESCPSPRAERAPCHP